MSSKVLLVGISAAALAAGSASAQQTTNTSTFSQFGINNVANVDNSREGNQFNSSTVIQNGTANVANVLQIGTFNRSYVEQLGNRNNARHEQTGNRNSVETRQDGDDHGSTIRQVGDDNIGLVSLSGQGNGSSINQSGQGHSASLTNSSSRIPRDARSNVSEITQTGTRARAEAFQFGNGDRSTINQNGTGQTFGSGATLQQAQPFASVSQRQFQAVSNVSQSGDNFAEVTQGLGSNSSVTIDQIDSGDTDVRQSNRALVAQYGDRNTTEVRQDAMNGGAIVWQQARLVQSSVSIDQGKGSVNAAAFTAPNQPIVPANGTSRDVQANVSQSGAFNATVVRQDGVTLRATVDQGGTGTAANRNSIRIEQTGSGHSATARQFAEVGPSDSAAPSAGEAGDPFSRAAGVQSAEIVILQSNMSNSATVEQFGRGQFARIEQTGQNNIASIAQLVAATNAVAVIRQTGNGNSYSVQQTQAGQYIMVSQTGNNNTVTDVVRRP